MVVIYSDDGQAWERVEPVAQRVVPVSRAAASQSSEAPPLDPMDYLDQLRPGTNRTLWRAARTDDGRGTWIRFDHAKANTTNGFKLPAPTEREAVLSDDAIDDAGVVLSQFVGSYAMYKQKNALNVYWNGVEFYSLNGKYVHSPLEFKKCIPRSFGFIGQVYIPLEDDVDDLAISEQTMDAARPDPFHKPGPPLVGRPAGARPGRVGWGADMAPKYHARSHRQVAGLSPAATFEEAWKHCTFEIHDVYTEPQKVFNERRLLLETTLLPIQAACTQLRLVNIEMINSKEQAREVYDQLPSGSDLVLIDPRTTFINATRERVEKPRRNADKATERGSVVVGHKLDGSGRLEALIVSGADSNVSTVNVTEGNLWVTDPILRTASQYNSALTTKSHAIKTCGDDAWRVALNAYMEDANNHAASEASCRSDTSRARAAFVADYTLNGSGLHDISPPAGSAQESGRRALHTAMSISIPIVGHGTGTPVNLLAWSPAQLENYARMFPRGSLVSYKNNAGNYTMTRVHVV